MGGNLDNIRLNSAEISDIYNTYVNDSIAVCLLTHFIEVVEDQEVLPILSQFLEVSQGHLKDLTKLFKSEGIVVPIGFPVEEHVRPGTSRLFHDTFYLEIVMHLSKFGAASYGAAVSMAARSDLRELFISYTNQAMQLHSLAKATMQSKGILIRPPYITYPTKLDYIQKQSFLTGFFGRRRPLLAVEISHLFTSAMNNEVGKALLTGFAQTVEDLEIKDYFLRGIRISKNILDSIHDTFVDSDLPFSMTWDASVTDSTKSPFSDKLMIMIANTLSALGVSVYGAALSTSMRRDLLALYGGFISKAGSYAEDGVNLMIERGWLEQPPTAEDRYGLVKQKKD